MNEQPDRDEQNDAEQLDPEVLGESVGDDNLPGIAGYPPEEPLGVEDPTLLQGGSEAEDDLATRNWRHGGDEDAEGMRILPVDGDQPLADDEARLIAQGVEAEEYPSPEEAALHIEEQPE